MSRRKSQTNILIFTLMTSSSIILGIFCLLAYIYHIDLDYVFRTFGKIKHQGQGHSSLTLKSSNSGGFAEVSDVPEGSFSYGGSTTWAVIRSKTEKRIETVFSNYELRYTHPTTGTPDSGIGIEMLLNNELAFSQTSRSIKEKEHEQAQMKGFTLTEIPVAIDGIAVAVHPDINIPGLTIANLRNIYAGKISNWKDLGGPDVKIIPYSKQNKGGTVEFFVKNVLHKEKFGKNIQTVKTTTEALKKVIQNRGGIFYASAPDLVVQCGIRPLPLGRVGEKLVTPYQEPFVPPSQCPQKRNQLNTAAFRSDEYPMTRRLFVVVKNNGRLEEDAGKAYAKLMLTQEGQRLISEAGFVRIR